MESVFKENTELGETTSKGMAGSVPVYCSFDAIAPVEELERNPKNPNTHPESQIILLAKIIKSQGWRAPITVSTRSGYIVKGHGRLLAAIYGGLKHVPVDYQYYDSKAEEDADLVADNRIAELSDIKDNLLADIFEDLKGIEDFDLELTGYSESEVEDILKGLSKDLEEELETVSVNQKYELVIACADERELEQMYSTFQAQGLAVKKSISQII